MALDTSSPHEKIRGASPSEEVALSPFQAAKTTRVGRLIAVIAIATVAIVLVMSFAKVDVVATGIGWVTPDNYGHAIRAPRSGYIAEKLVLDGHPVGSGTVIGRYDCGSERQSYDAASSGVALRRRELAKTLAVADRILPAQQARQLRAAYGPQIGALSVTDQDAIGVEANLAVERTRQAALKIDNASAASAVARSQLDSARSARHLAQVRLDRQTKLAAQGYASQAAMEISANELAVASATEQAALNALRQFDVQSRDGAAQAAIEAMNEHSKLFSAATSLAAEIAKADSDGAVLRNGLRGCEIVANTSGQVFWLASIAPGSWVQSSTPLFKIVPLTQGLAVDARLREQDVAFLRSGQSAIVKVNGLPYITYGSLRGRLRFVSPDTLEDQKKSGTYKVVIDIDDAKSWEAAHGVELRPGMMITVDIVTGQRRVIEYFISPALEAVSHSFRER